jgi:hypothetical protein
VAEALQLQLAQEAGAAWEASEPERCVGAARLVQHVAALATGKPGEAAAAAGMATGAAQLLQALKPRMAAGPSGPAAAFAAGAM